MRFPASGRERDREARLRYATVRPFRVEDEAPDFRRRVVLFVRAQRTSGADTLGRDWERLRRRRRRCPVARGDYSGCSLLRHADVVRLVTEGLLKSTRWINPARGRRPILAIHPASGFPAVQFHLS